MTPNSRDVIVGFTVVLFAGFTLLVLIPQGIPTPGRTAPGQMLPDFWPRVITSGLVAIGVLIALLAIFAPTVEEAGEELDEPHPPMVATLKVVTAIVLMFGYLWLIQLIGMVVASMIAIPLFSVLYGERRVWIYVPLAIVLPVLLYVFFRHVASIPIPDPLLRQIL
jgi:putative tricarboxylic transport membrane protein